MLKTSRRRAAYAASMLVGTSVFVGCSAPDPAPVARSAPPLAETSISRISEPSVTTTSVLPKAPPQTSAAPVIRPDSTSATASAPRHSSQAVPAPSSVAPTASQQRVFLVECASSNPVIRPTSFTLACGDGNESLTGVAWNSWGSGTATATATYVVNSCDPSCAQGTPVSYPVRVTANHLTARPGGKVYENLTVTFGAHRPAGAAATEDFPMLG